MENEISNMKVALFLAEHIENPCPVYVKGERLDVRAHHMGLAERVIPTFIDPAARDWCISH